MSDDPYYMTAEQEREAIIKEASNQMWEATAIIDDLPGEAREQLLHDLADRYCEHCFVQRQHCRCPSPEIIETDIPW